MISDLDLDALHQSREVGSVRSLRDRRADLFERVSKIDVTMVRTQ